MRPPRMARNAGSDAVSKSVPSNRTEPASAVRGGSKRVSASATVDLPDPDSPTSAGIRPVSSVKLTPSTARTASPRPWYVTERLRTSSNGIADPLTQQIERQHRDQDGQPGCDGEPPRHPERDASFIQDVAPAWRGRLKAQPQETQGGV